jgi:tripartite-type tricarboxylate transporter receptor subunit TctC
MAPSAMPPAAVAKLNGAVNQVLAEADFARRLGEMGLSLVGGTPQSFGQKLTEETAKWRKVIQDAHIPPPA